MEYLKQHLTGFIGGILVLGMLLLGFFYYNLSKQVVIQGNTLQQIVNLINQAQPPKTK